MHSFLNESPFSDGLIEELQQQHRSSVASGKTTERLSSARLSTGLGSPRTGTSLVLWNSLFFCSPLGSDRGRTPKVQRKAQIAQLTHPHFDRLQGPQCSTQAAWAGNAYTRCLPI